LPQSYIIPDKQDILAGVFMAYKLKKLSETDRTAVIDIFNYFVKNSFAAYPESEVQYQKFDRFLDITAGYPAITVRDESDEYFISEAKTMGIRIFLASISSLNEQSIQFHLKHGFVECGRFKGIGKKHGRTFDMIWMQKYL
jgi:phosphinothricin acetyltransferase